MINIKTSAQLALTAILLFNQVTFLAIPVMADVNSGVAAAQNTSITLPTIGTNANSPSATPPGGTPYTFAPTSMVPNDSVTGLFNQADIENNSGTETDIVNYSVGAEATIRANTDSVYFKALDTAAQVKSRPLPNMATDPIWSQTDTVMADLATFEKNFADCSTTTVFTTTTVTTQLSDLKHCTRVKKPSYSCDIPHNITVTPVQSTYNYEIRVTVWDTSGHNEHCTVMVRNPTTGATVKLDAHVDQSGSPDNPIGLREMNPTVCETLINYYITHPIGYGGGHKDYDTKLQAIGIDIIPYTAANYSRTYPLEMDVMGCNGLCTSWSPRSMTVTQYNVTDDWPISPDCRLLLDGIDDGFCTAPAYNCTGQYPGTGDCRQIGGAQVCRSDLTPSPEPPNNVQPFNPAGCFVLGTGTVCISPTQVDPSCTPLFLSWMCPLAVMPPTELIDRFCNNLQITVQDCDINTGTFCYTNNDGSQTCIPNSDANLNGCAIYENDPDCGFIGTSCVAQGSSGNCYIANETWDCGAAVSIPTVEQNTQTVCAGPIRCMGTDCVDPTKETSADFARAAAALQAMQSIQQDLDCAGTNPASSTCTVFSGKPGWCKKAVGGTVDCCKDPGGIDFGDYISLLFNINMLDNAVMGMEKMTAVRSGYEVIRQPVADAAAAMKKPFTDAWASISGTTTDTVTDAAAASTLDQFKQKTIEKTAEWVAQTFGEDAANMLFQAGASQAGGSTTGNAFTTDAAGNTTMTSNATSNGVAMNPAITNAISTVMTAYTTYLIAMAVIQIIYECEDIEMETVMKRELRSCHYLGTYCEDDTPLGCLVEHETYCCFNSPLSRIMNEQIRSQLGLGWGAVDNPSCEGITLSDLDRIDWNLVDLDEWLAILVTTNNFPDPAQMDLEKLTGTGHVLDVDTANPRMNAEDRLRARLNGSPADDTRMIYDAQIR